ncbi:hypothetical protein LCGC14_2157480, partial [marine sediment metagenome]
MRTTCSPDKQFFSNRSVLSQVRAHKGPGRIVGTVDSSHRLLCTGF